MAPNWSGSMESRWRWTKDLERDWQWKMKSKGAVPSPMAPFVLSGLVLLLR